MHSHLAIRHLIQHVSTRTRGSLVRQRVPESVLAFIDDVCQMFEPFTGVARAGYECLYGGDRWAVSVYLGEREAYGGALDGALRPVNFRIDVQALAQLFESVSSIGWNSISDRVSESPDLECESFLTIEGTARREPISLQVHALPPQEAGPAMREYVDGRWELV
jgi:hypothetical protein